MIALFAAVQAKPYFYYGLPHHVPLVYTHPVVKVEPKNAPCKNDAGEEVPCALINPPYYALAGLPHLAPAAEAPAEERKKREAEPEAEVEADPWLLYSGYYGHPGYYG